MQRFRWLMSVVAVGFAVEACAADETPAALDALLKAWSTASRDCRSLDTRFTVFYRDTAFGDRTDQGRLYFEAPDAGRFEIGKDDVLIWQSGSCLHLMGNSKRFCRITSKEVVALRQFELELLSQGQRRSWFADIMLEVTQLYLTQPQTAIPNLLLTDVGGFRERYDLKLDEKDGKPWLIATPKPTDEYRCSELQFIFDGATHLPEAVKEIRLSGEKVFVLYDTRLDDKPADRDRLLNPDLKIWTSERPLGAD